MGMIRLGSTVQVSFCRRRKCALLSAQFHTLYFTTLDGNGYS